MGGKEARELIQVWRNKELPGGHEPAYSSAAAGGKVVGEGWRANWPTDWVSDYRYEFPQPLWEKNNRCQAIFPPFLPRSSVLLLWKWAKPVHKKLDSLLWTKQCCSVLLVQTCAFHYICTATYSGRHPVRWCQWIGKKKIKNKKILIGGVIVQSKLGPSVACLCTVSNIKMIKHPQCSLYQIFLSFFPYSSCLASKCCFSLTSLLLLSPRAHG